MSFLIIQRQNIIFWIKFSLLFNHEYSINNSFFKSIILILIPSFGLKSSTKYNKYLILFNLNNNYFFKK